MRAHARARGYVIGRGVYYILYIYYISARTFFYLSKYSLSDAHFSTGRLLFEFNRLQYTLAAPEVFVSSANPVILPSGYRVSIVRNTNIYQIETTPLLYCRYAYSRLYYYTLALGLIGSVCHPTIFRLSTRGSKLRLDLSLVLRQHSGSTFLCCSISLHLKRSMGNC